MMGGGSQSSTSETSTSETSSSESSSSESSSSSSNSRRVKQHQQPGNGTQMEMNSTQSRSHQRTHSQVEGPSVNPNERRNEQSQGSGEEGQQGQTSQPGAMPSSSSSSSPPSSSAGDSVNNGGNKNHMEDNSRIDATPGVANTDTDTQEGNVGLAEQHRQRHLYPDQRYPSPPPPHQFGGYGSMGGRMGMSMMPPPGMGMPHPMHPPMHMPMPMPMHMQPPPYAHHEQQRHGAYPHAPHHIMPPPPPHMPMPVPMQMSPTHPAHMHPPHAHTPSPPPFLHHHPPHLMHSYGQPLTHPHHAHHSPMHMYAEPGSHQHPYPAPPTHGHMMRATPASLPSGDDSSMRGNSERDEPSPGLSSPNPDEQAQAAGATPPSSAPHTRSQQQYGGVGGGAPLSGANPHTATPAVPMTGNMSRSMQNNTNANTAGTDALYKTELCRSFSEIGSCRYGQKCRFAHGPAELRPKVLHKKYKTELCANYERDGHCPYGHRCVFIHGSEEKEAIDREKRMRDDNANGDRDAPPFAMTMSHTQPHKQKYGSVYPATATERHDRRPNSDKKQPMNLHSLAASLPKVSTEADAHADAMPASSPGTGLVLGHDDVDQGETQEDEPQMPAVGEADVGSIQHHHRSPIAGPTSLQPSSTSRSPVISMLQSTPPIVIASPHSANVSRSSNHANIGSKVGSVSSGSPHSLSVGLHVSSFSSSPPRSLTHRLSVSHEDDPIVPPFASHSLSRSPVIGPQPIPMHAQSNNNKSTLSSNMQAPSSSSVSSRKGSNTTSLSPKPSAAHHTSPFSGGLSAAAVGLLPGLSLGPVVNPNHAAQSSMQNDGNGKSDSLKRHSHNTSISSTGPSSTSPSTGSSSDILHTMQGGWVGSAISSQSGPTNNGGNNQSTVPASSPSSVLFSHSNSHSPILSASVASAVTDSTNTDKHAHPLPSTSSPILMGLTGHSHSNSNGNGSGTGLGVNVNGSAQDDEDESSSSLFSSPILPSSSPSVTRVRDMDALDIGPNMHANKQKQTTNMT